MVLDSLSKTLKNQGLMKKNLVGQEIVYGHLIF